jgi:hypothetical protein
VTDLLLYPGCCRLPVEDVLLYPFMLAVASFVSGVKAGLCCIVVVGFFSGQSSMSRVPKSSVPPFVFLWLLSLVGLSRCLLLELAVVRGGGGH